MGGLKPQRKTTKPVFSKKTTQEPKKVKEQTKKKRRPVAPPPLFPLYIKGVKNPLIDSKRSKRPLTVALARLTKDDELLIRAVRYSGVLYKTGITSFVVERTELSKNEHSGKGYAIGTGRKMQESYYNDYPEKVNACVEFATLLVEVCKLPQDKMDEILRKGQDAYDSRKVELEVTDDKEEENEGE